jgi:hypothetical protein
MAIIRRPVASAILFWEIHQKTQRRGERSQVTTKVARTSKSAVSRVSKPAAGTTAVGLADLEVGDTAGLETCATKFGGFCLFWPAHVLA